MSFEHYPFAPCGAQTEQNLLNEPGLVGGIVKTWQADGLPVGTPLLITESNYSSEYDRALPGYLGGALAGRRRGEFHGRRRVVVLSVRVRARSAVRLLALRHGLGVVGMWNATTHYTIKQPTSQYFAAQLLTQQWSQPVDAAHALHPARTDVVDSHGRQIVTAYAVQRPDGQWAVLLVNKDPTTAYTVAVAFNGASGAQYLSYPVAQVTFGPAQYVWHSNKRAGNASPDGPPATATAGGGAGGDLLGAGVRTRRAAGRIGG